MIKLIPYFLASTLLFGQSEAEKAFTKIYSYGTWDESGFSLSGSQVEVTREYMDYLQEFLKTHEIKKVVDLGCGDWAFSRYIDWEGIEYIGYDIVPSVIERNTRLFSAPNITFIYANIEEIDLPDADLVLCKDVFQHLPNTSIHHLLKKMEKYPRCIITNYIDMVKPNRNNRDIKIGYYHPISLTKAPFNVQGEVVLRFLSGIGCKETVYIHP